MNKEELAPGIVLYKNVIQENDSLAADIEDSVILGAASWDQAYVTAGENTSINKSSRDTEIIGIPYSLSPVEDFSSQQSAFSSALSKIFFEAFSPIEKEYSENYGISLEWHDSYQILKYGKGQKFTNHIDDHQKYPRRVSMVYYMNDNYTGGEIIFPRFGISHKPKANELILFPSTYVYNHSVSEVIEGTRYSVVSWLS
jgi:Rps23 Pro-64 3,4-dihydroxylase Tpa1-like proline 4-hydroxylase